MSKGLSENFIGFYVDEDSRLICVPCALDSTEKGTWVSDVEALPDGFTCADCGVSQ